MKSLMMAILLVSFSSPWLLAEDLTAVWSMDSLTLASIDSEESDMEGGGGNLPPFFVTSFSEIQDLPAADQKKYLDQLRDLAKDFPKDLLAVPTNNECEKNQLLCQPPLFGSGACVPQEKADYHTCRRQLTDQRMSLFFREPNSESIWDDFQRKIQDYCSQTTNIERCKRLQDIRIELFMNRSSH